MGQDVREGGPETPSPVATAPAAPPAEDVASGAIRRYEERLARDPYSMAWAPLADAYRKAGRARDAIELCRDGLARFPQYHTARLILAKAHLDEGDAGAALSVLETVREAGVRDAEAYRLAGELYRRAGRLNQAVERLAEAVRLDPSDREARLTLESLEAQGRVPGHSPLAAVLADDTFATLTFGALCLEQGLAEEAAQVFLRRLRTYPEDARARDGLDQALRVKTQKRKGS
jgi:tetratricopeptide (TPR) repeat protein